jgi:hypothetical protein
MVQQNAGIRQLRRARAAIVGRQSDAGDVIFYQPVGHVERKSQLVRSELPAESITGSPHFPTK